MIVAAEGSSQRKFRSALELEACLRTVLALSLLANIFVVFYLTFPTAQPWPRLSCQDAGNEKLNKVKTLAFARENMNSWAKTDGFLRNSGYILRNIEAIDGGVVLVYVSDGYQRYCISSAFRVDTSIVRLLTDLKADPLVRDAW